MPRKPLIIEGRIIQYGELVAAPGGNEAGVAGLLPVSLFKSVYICNSEGYVILRFERPADSLPPGSGCGEARMARSKAQPRM